MLKADIDKQALVAQIQRELELLLQNAIDSAERALITATAKESIAENKYDTFGLEASYLAQGQSKRVAECEADLVVFQQLITRAAIQESRVTLGVLIFLMDELSQQKILFLAPVAGGMKLRFQNYDVVVVTPAAPIGKALVGRKVDDEIELSLGSQKKEYTIIQIV